MAAREEAGRYGARTAGPAHSVPRAELKTLIEPAQNLKRTATSINVACGHSGVFNSSNLQFSDSYPMIVDWERIVRIFQWAPSTPRESKSRRRGMRRRALSASLLHAWPRTDDSRADTINIS